jgi:protein involved in polysaccharide export with SLBB domain
MRKETIFVILVIVAASLIGCATDQAVQQAIPAAQAPSTNKPAVYVIQPGDELDIKFFYNPELNETLTVRPDGMISLQLVDEIKAAGKTPAELDKALTDLYSRELRKPIVTVIVRTFTGQRIYVGGEVNRAGLLELPAGMTAIQAVFQAGGFRETAQPAETLVIRKGPDNRPVPIRVNLTSVMKGNEEGADFRLQPDDVVYVPKSAIAQANKFVNQYIEQLFLFRGVSLGFSYELHSDD